MKILNIEIENFLGIGQASVNLDRGGITLVEGLNNDSTTSVSNGAGKSTLFDALYWAFYGQTRHGSKADEVVNRFTAGGCRVAVNAEINGKPCVITRTRKYGKAAENALKIDVDGDDITQGVTRDTQALLEDLLGMGALTFSKAVFFGQGDVKPFAGLTDSELKVVFEQALGLTWFSDSRAKVGGCLSGLKQQALQDETNILLLAGNRNLVQNKVDSQRESIAKDEEAEKTWRQSIEATIKEQQDRVAMVTAEHKTLSDEKVGLHATVDAHTTKLDELNALHAKLSEAIASENTTLARTDTTFNGLKRNIADLLRRTDALGGMVGATCPTCVQVVEPENVKQAQEKMKAEALVIEQEAGKQKDGYMAAQTRRGKYNALLDQLCDKIKTTGDVIKASMNRIGEISGKLMVYNETLTNAGKNIEGLQERLAAGSTKAAEIVAARNILDMLLTELDMAQDRIVQLNNSITAKVARREAVQILHDALGNAGVKSYVFDSITPELNSHGNRYLQILDPDLGVEISTVSKLKTGEYRERFSVNITNANGANSLSGSSGGERQKVNLAIALAFNKLMRSMAGSDVPLMVLDEPFEALDSGSSDQVFELLKELDADNLYLITHNESVRDLLPARMLVTKTGGVATVSEGV